MTAVASRSAAVLGVLVAAGCTSGQVGSLPQQRPSNVAAVAKLQLAVGTATMALPGGGSVVGLNVVATFRAPGGQNATLVNTPTLSGPALFDGTHAITGDTPALLAAYAAAKTPISAPPGVGVPAPTPSGLPEPGDFGSLVGVYGYGLAPLNLQSTTEYNVVFPAQACDGVTLSNVDVSTGTSSVGSPRYDALDLPIYGNTNSAKPNAGGQGSGCLAFLGSLGSNTPTTYRYYGGPPAWPSPQGYGLPSGFLGYPAGFTTFATAPVTGAYALDAAYPATSDGQTYNHSTASATLGSTTALPPFPRPNVRLQSDGSAQIDVTVPPGLSEAIVFVSSDACVNDTSGNAGVNNYSVLLGGQPGTQTVVLSKNLGPPTSSGTPSDTFCTATDDKAPNANLKHTYSATAVGFDYPAFEASYPKNVQLAPTIANAAGQADLTVSDPIVNVNYSLQ